MLGCLFLISATDADTITLATGEWRPYSSSEMEGYGEFTKMVTTIMEEMGHTPEYRFYPWARCFDAVVKGRIWAAFPYSYNEERGEQVWFSDPLSVSRTVFFYFELPGTRKEFNVKQLSDLSQYKIGGVTGYFYAPILKRAGLEVDYANSEVQSLEKLLLGRIELIPMNDAVGRECIKAHFPDRVDQFKTLDFELSVNELRLIVSRSYPNSKQLLESFNKALQLVMEKESPEGRTH